MSEGFSFATGPNRTSRTFFFASSVCLPKGWWLFLGFLGIAMATRAGWLTSPNKAASSAWWETHFLVEGEFE